MGISRRAYALHRGVSDMAVRKAIRAGRILVEADGTIDPAKADRDWDRHTDPAMQRGAAARSRGVRTAAATAAAGPAMKAVQPAALQAVEDTLAEGGGAATEGSAPAFMRARVANEVLKAQIQRERLKEMKGETVDRARAAAMVFDLARQERDAWIGWPARVAANMAAELGVDAHTMEQVLDRYLREHLAELGEVKVELR